MVARHIVEASQRNCERSRLCVGVNELGGFDGHDGIFDAGQSNIVIVVPANMSVLEW
jgi:hypothetical protein